MSAVVYLFPSLKMLLATKVKEEEVVVKKKEMAVKKKEMALTNMVQGGTKKI